ncbi:MAG: DUF72 domain-containing protein [Gammaproteobacteria bacterium]|nr:DUF72 domain-containing protein [Gammaproteobacteria bacterium]
MSGRDPQPDLFGGGPQDEPAARAPRGRASKGGIAPAPADPALAALAARIPGTVRFGTSTWSFPGWAGIVYGGEHDEAKLARDGLAAYARHPLLRAVGVDRSFYAPLTAPTLERMAAAVSPDFRFLLKAHAALTTPRSARRPAFLQGAPEAFLDADYATRVVVDPARRLLGDKLGVVLFQFSPLGERVLRHRALLLERLGAFLAALPRGVAYACEWRDAAMLGPDYHATLAAAGAVHGFCAHPRMPPVDEQGAGPDAAGTAAGPLVIRWLLRGDRGYDEARAEYAPFDKLCDPDPAVRRRIAAMLASAAARGREAVLIVNNKAEGSAPLSIAALAREMAGGVGG